MTTADLVSVLRWWLVMFGIGLVFLPLTSLIFAKFFDRGYTLAKPLGLLFFGYTVWLAASLKIIPFANWSLFLLLAIWLVVNLKLAFSYPGKKGPFFLNFSARHLKVFLLEELLFLVGLLFWSFVRAHEPSIHGLEKFMDFGFINSILRSTYFPPADMWMTPLSINYYYFGHFLAALLTKLSGLDSIITYNIMVAHLFALTLTCSFTLGANFYFLYAKEKLAGGNFILRKRWLITAGLLSAFLVTLGGNLHTIYLFFMTYPDPENPTPFWQLPFGFNPSLYWYPNATRFIPFTIHEFPIYSFVVSDLHGHVLNIPFALLTMAVGIKVFLQKHFHRASYLLAGLLLGVSLMTNVLDGPIYLLFFAVLALVFYQPKSWLASFPKAATSVLLILVLAISFSLPYWLEFKPFAQGIGVLCAPDFLTKAGRLGPFLFEGEHCARSPLWMLVILWGFFYFVVLGFLV